MKEYKRVVQYYETDKMGITHHSNYVRWMEEARVDYLEQIGWSYAKLEEAGIISPVTNVECGYKKPTTFSDEVYISLSIAEYNGVKLVFKYTMKNKNGEVVCEAKSSHCFLNSNGQFVFISKFNPELHQTLKDLIAQ
ncbi:MAG: acyl-CoA thioesterase [Bacilli bacterium]|nr:acyl-CoA thioesterase [Bacilli bacterium]